MKYMTFNSSCSYAGLANLVSFYGVDTEDREIALKIGLPFLFAYEDGCYLAGPMLQSGKWFNIYLKTVGLLITEQEVKREQICEYLRTLEYAMLGIHVSGANKHAVVYTGISGGKFSMINNKRENSDEPDTLLLSEQELMQRVAEMVTVAHLSRAACEAVNIEGALKNSVSVLQALCEDIEVFCSQEKTAEDIRSSMDTLFRAILLDGVTMLDLIGKTHISKNLKIIQGQFINAVKSNRGLTLNKCLDVPLLKKAIQEYSELICVRIDERVKGL